LNKKKIFNDPVYGFITVPGDLIFDVIEHPYFQRLRRIKQLGLTDYVYPGALHTRFHHALGALHLMQQALGHLRLKGHEVSEAEFEGACLAILLHDVGHGPFSHALEFSLLKDIPHERLSLLLMEAIDKDMGGALQLAIQMFKNTYHRTFFHQLISSQLDIDRLDYLNRDSFFTGVSEGTIGADRIIKLLEIKDDHLVVEEKGIYSIENFLNARRLMYWQVYLHKASVSAECMLIGLINRAKHLAMSGEPLYASRALQTFLSRDCSLADFEQNPDFIHDFAQLDDYDVWGAIKLWQDYPDKILRNLSRGLLQRKLFKIKVHNGIFMGDEVKKWKKEVQDKFHLTKSELPYFFYQGSLSNAAYLSTRRIHILTKKGEVVDIASAADLPNIQALTKIVKKSYVCFPKQLPT
jgi:HD superfamily phosphohydrolase